MAFTISKNLSLKSFFQFNLMICTFCLWASVRATSLEFLFLQARLLCLKILISSVVSLRAANNWIHISVDFPKQTFSSLVFLPSSKAYFSNWTELKQEGQNDNEINMTGHIWSALLNLVILGIDRNEAWNSITKYFH